MNVPERCLECDGGGLVECPEMCGEDPDCPVCCGDGEVDCDICDGTGDAE